MERSPLAAVWFLHKKHGMSLEEAYKGAKFARPIVIEHLDWLR